MKENRSVQGRRRGRGITATFPKSRVPRSSGKPRHREGASPGRQSVAAVSPRSRAASGRRRRHGDDRGRLCRLPDMADVLPRFAPAVTPTGSFAGGFPREVELSLQLSQKISRSRVSQPLDYRSFPPEGGKIGWESNPRNRFLPLQGGSSRTSGIKPKRSFYP